MLQFHLAEEETNIKQRLHGAESLEEIMQILKEIGLLKLLVWHNVLFLAVSNNMALRDRWAFSLTLM